eukprot:5185624-Pyramimonas_sp.AAC.1
MGGSMSELSGSTTVMAALSEYVRARLLCTPQCAVTRSVASPAERPVTRVANPALTLGGGRPAPHMGTCGFCAP